MEKNTKVRFKRFVFREGYTWKAGGEGRVVAETETSYKVKTNNWFGFPEWVPKTQAEIINYLPTKID